MFYFLLIQLLEKSWRNLNSHDRMFRAHDIRLAFPFASTAGRSFFPPLPGIELAESRSLTRRTSAALRVGR